MEGSAKLYSIFVPYIAAIFLFESSFPLKLVGVTVGRLRAKKKKN
jgi:hypothetical protein